MALEVPRSNRGGGTIANVNAGFLGWCRSGKAMTEDPPKRRTLSLKPGVQVTRPLGPQPLAPLRTDKPRPFRSSRPPRESKPVERPSHGWKCKPCGAFFDPPAEGPDDEVVRCPSCNARIGVAGDFRQTPPAARLRARPMRH